jgi:CRISPR-associated protein Cst2
MSKVNIASLNGGEGTGGNVVAIKKITDNHGDEFAYISGQAQRRYLKETLRQLGENITAVNEKGEPDFGEYNTKIYASDKSEKFKDVELMYKNFCDLDLFGEYDYLTRKQAVKDETKKSGNIVQVEIDTLNFMRGNILIDADKIGKDINEYNYEFNQILSDEEINHRIDTLIEAIKVFNGGAKQSRHLEDISPKFVVAISQRAGNPFLLNAFKIDKYNNLEVKPIIEAIKENSDYIESKAAGMTTNVFQNEEEIKSKFQEINVEVTSISQALDTLKKKRE